MKRSRSIQESKFNRGLATCAAWRWSLDGRFCAAAIVLLGMLFSMGRPCYAQSLWEVTPYRLEVWLNLESHPEVPVAWQNLPVEIAERAQTVVGSPWDVHAQLTPPTQRRATTLPSPPNAVEFLKVNADLAERDKLMTVAVNADSDGYEISARELDISTRIWSDLASRRVSENSDIADEIVNLLCDVFVPLVKIVRVEENEVWAQIKAGGLSRPAESLRKWQNPTEIQEGSFLRPFIRKRDRDGKVKDDGIETVKYTVLRVKSRDEGTIVCETFSGYKQPFRTRRSSRADQLALVARARGDSTVLRAHDRKDEKMALPGFDVYARGPGSDVSELIGRTDWQGKAVIPKSDSPVRILFLKSGSRVLAKMPIVPGLQQQIDVGLRNDEARLEAEGFLIGIQESLVDLVARREILSARIQRRIEDKKFDEADEMLEQLRRLPTRDDFENLVQQRKQLLVINDESVQDKIDQLFADTRKLFSTYLDPRRVQELGEKLANARDR